MTRFLIPVTIEFDATVMVKADTQEEAEILAVTKIAAKLESDNLTFDKECIDQVTYNPTGYPRMRDNESVEEEGDEEEI